MSNVLVTGSAADSVDLSGANEQCAGHGKIVHTNIHADCTGTDDQTRDCDANDQFDADKQLSDTAGHAEPDHQLAAGQRIH